MKISNNLRSEKRRRSHQAKGANSNPNNSQAVVEVVEPTPWETHRLPAWKRPLDISLVLLTLPIVAPLTALLAVCIKLVSPGPVFFRQERIGYRGRRFRVLKFRSMHVNADPELHQKHLQQLMSADKPLQKMDKHDPRVIPLGRLFRASGLDELAQLWNVLRGDMSLVGPRPCIDFEYKQYRGNQRLRFATLPGLTGLWQVSGKTKTTFQQMIQLDLEYVRRQSLWLDLSILFRTFPAVIKLLWEARMPSTRARSEHAVIKPTGKEAAVNNITIQGV